MFGNIYIHMSGYEGSKTPLASSSSDSQIYALADEVEKKISDLSAAVSSQKNPLPFKVELEALVMDYQLNAVEFFLDFNLEKYVRQLLTNRIVERMARLETKLGMKGTNSKLLARKVMATHQEEREVAYDHCGDCEASMRVRPESSELICELCGQTRRLEGIVFDKSQIYCQEGQKPKSAAFKPTVHFQFWLKRILGQESENELGEKSEEMLKTFRDAVADEKKIDPEFTCAVEDVRYLLKKAKKTSLNKNTTQILRRLTGVGPPDISQELAGRVGKLFSTVNKISEELWATKNRHYYPYYIYKLLEASDLPKETERVLFYIHLQGQPTLNKHDRCWREICARLDGVEWKPTNRVRSMKTNMTAQKTYLASIK